MDAEFAPTTSLERLQQRSELLRVVRDCFHQYGYWEVQTPTVSRDTVVDIWLDPFEVACTDPETRYLQTSPEFAMKRLLAAGASKIYQIGPAFRRNESGMLHRPEFTMVEWYAVGETYRQQMDFTEQLVDDVLRRCRDWHPAAPRMERPCRRWTYDEAFERQLGHRVLSLSAQQLAEVARRNAVTAPDSLSDGDLDEWRNLLLAELIEPHLGKSAPEFLIDYPASQSALARVRNDVTPVAERFELYIGGVELCNGYQELLDADELMRRNESNNRVRCEAGKQPLPVESQLLEAMRTGLPECSGVALGFDRLIMVGLGLDSIDQVIAFPWERA